MTEWEYFLEGIASSPRPPSVEHREFAVDASDFRTRFAREFEWCEHGNRGDGDFPIHTGLGNHNLDTWTNKPEGLINTSIPMSVHHRSVDEATRNKGHDRHHGAETISADIANAAIDTARHEGETPPGIGVSSQESLQANAASSSHDWADLGKQHAEVRQKASG